MRMGKTEGERPDAFVELQLDLSAGIVSFSIEHLNLDSGMDVVEIVLSSRTVSRKWMDVVEFARTSW